MDAPRNLDEIRIFGSMVRYGRLFVEVSSRYSITDPVVVVCVVFRGRIPVVELPRDSGEISLWLKLANHGQIAFPEVTV
jgi:hypothetical protein